MGVVLRWVIIGIVALAAWPRHAAAQDYPTHSVTILVPFAPGGGTDLIARAIGQKLEQRLGKSFVIENRPGAGTTIAAGATAKAARQATQEVCVKIAEQAVPAGPARDQTVAACKKTTP